MKRAVAWLGRLIHHEDIDLYLLVGVALVFTILGVTGVDQKWVTACVLALLALLALSQIRSRHQVAAIRKSHEVEPLGRLLVDFPQELEGRRNSGQDVLLVGASLSRTIQSYRRYIPQTMARKGRVRILLLDPRIASVMSTSGQQSRMAKRIENSLAELELIKAENPELEVRLMSREPSMGFNVIDPDAVDGIVVIQHQEFHPDGESKPIMLLRPTDGTWYGHFLGEANRMWEDGEPWPSSGRGTGRYHARPSFVTEFGAQFKESMAAASDLLITGVARNELLMTNFSLFESAVRRGCAIRIVLVNPESSAVEIAASRYYVERSAANLRNRIHQSQGLLQALALNTGGSVELRFCDHPLAVGCIAVNTAQSRDQSLLYLEYYTHQAPGEPKFVLDSSDGAAFDTFQNEAEVLWKSGAPVLPDSEG